MPSPKQEAGPRGSVEMLHVVLGRGWEPDSNSEGRAAHKLPTNHIVLHSTSFRNHSLPMKFLPRGTHHWLKGTPKLE